MRADAGSPVVSYEGEDHRGGAEAVPRRLPGGEHGPVVEELEPGSRPDVRRHAHRRVERVGVDDSEGLAELLQPSGVRTREKRRLGLRVGAVPL